MATTASFNGSERRKRADLREIFEEAYRVVCPMLDSNQTFNNTGSAHFIRILVHDAFPDMHQQDIAIISVAIERVYVERSKGPK